jgi:hypothetical protein
MALAGEHESDLLERRIDIAPLIPGEASLLYV